MKNNLLIVLVFISCFLSYGVYAQNSKVYITDKTNEKYVYVNVTKTYERVAEKGYKSIDLFQKLGNAFYTNLEMEKAARWYGELFAMTYDLEPKYYNQYAESLKCIGKIEMANEILKKLDQILKLKADRKQQKGKS